MAQSLKNLRNFYTHGGVFHADEVFSTALLEIYLGRPVIPNRVFKVPESIVDDEETIIYDIGGGKFDHHQEGSEVRDDEEKTPYSSFGLIWREVGPEMFGPEDAEAFDRNFVKAIDLTDNTGIPNPMSAAVSGFNPSWKKGGDGNEEFNRAVLFALNVLKIQFQNIRDRQEAADLAMEYISKAEEGIAVFEQYLPAGRLLAESDCIYSIFPSNRGGWNLETVKQAGTDKPVDKKPLPASWLEPSNAPNGMSPCHKGLFIAAFDTKEHAIRAAYKALVI